MLVSKIKIFDLVTNINILFIPSIFCPHAARNVLANSDYCPYCLSAGGVGVVSNGKSWPSKHHGLCGDPFSQATPRNHEAGGKYWSGRPTATYQKGQIVQFTTQLSAFHRGRLGFRICKIVGTSIAAEQEQLSEDCFQQSVLKQANVPGAQAPGDPWFHLGRIETTGATTTFTASYQLPKDLVCDGQTAKCILQWYYLTGNSCNPPGEPSKYSNTGLETCGAGAPFPEEFWNCADVRIIDEETPFLTPSPENDDQSSSSANPPPPSPRSNNRKKRPPPLKPSRRKQRKPPPLNNNNYSTTSAAQFCATKALGMYADRKSDCRAYYQCDITGSWWFQCPADLKFNQQVSVCDWPINVNC